MFKYMVPIIADRHQWDEDQLRLLRSEVPVHSG